VTFRETPEVQQFRVETAQMTDSNVASSCLNNSFKVILWECAVAFVFVSEGGRMRMENGGGVQREREREREMDGE